MRHQFRAPRPPTFHPSTVFALLLCGFSCSLGGCSAGGRNDGPPPAGQTSVQPMGSGGASPVVVEGAGGAPTGTGGQEALSHDPTLFSWPEANPDGSLVQLCKAGHYVGTYTCIVKQSAGIFGPPAGDAGGGYLLNGPVDLTLSQSQDGEFLSVSGGTLKSAAGFLALDATVSGKLNCQTGAFDGQLLNGTVAIPPFPSGGSFTGPLSASFDPNSGTLKGVWTLIGGPQFAGSSCTGPWNATWQSQ